MRLCDYINEAISHGYNGKYEYLPTFDSSEEEMLEWLKSLSIEGYKWTEDRTIKYPPIGKLYYMSGPWDHRKDSAWIRVTNHWGQSIKIVSKSGKPSTLEGVFIKTKSGIPFDKAVSIVAKVFVPNANRKIEEEDFSDRNLAI
jgi:hypothetical protein